jgi:hypothetical protein
MYFKTQKEKLNLISFEKKGGGEYDYFFRCLYGTNINMERNSKITLQLGVVAVVVVVVVTVVEVVVVTVVVVGGGILSIAKELAVIE